MRSRVKYMLWSIINHKRFVAKLVFFTTWLSRVRVDCMYNVHNHGRFVFPLGIPRISSITRHFCLIFHVCRRHPRIRRTEYGTVVEYRYAFWNEGVYTVQLAREYQTSGIKCPWHSYRYRLMSVWSYRWICSAMDHGRQTTPTLTERTTLLTLYSS